MNGWKVLFRQLAEKPAWCVGYAFAVFALVVLISLLSLLIWPGDFIERVYQSAQISLVPAALPVILASLNQKG